MITQTVDPHHFIRRARQIKAQIPLLLSQWGLLPKFKRWRLAQDPGSGMVVLFGVLNNKYIATHTTTPFSNYFDPHLLRDLTAELHVQVISSANDGLRYAFILERGGLGPPPALIETLEQGAIDQASPRPKNSSPVNEQPILRDRLARFLLITEAVDALNNATEQRLLDVLFIDEVEFNRQMAEYETNRNNNLPMS